MSIVQLTGNKQIGDWEEKHYRTKKKKKYLRRKRVGGRCDVAGSGWGWGLKATGTAEVQSCKSKTSVDKILIKNLLACNTCFLLA